MAPLAIVRFASELPTCFERSRIAAGWWRALRGCPGIGGRKRTETAVTPAYAQKQVLIVSAATYTRTADSPMACRTRYAYVRAHFGDDEVRAVSEAFPSVGSRFWAEFWLGVLVVTISAGALIAAMLLIAIHT